MFEFADSEVAAVGVEAGTLRVRFAAAQVRFPREGGLGEAFGHLAGLALVAGGGPWPGLDTRGIGRLVGGCLESDGQRLQALPLDFDCPGLAVLELGFAQGMVLRVGVRAVRVTVPPHARFTDSLAC